MLVNLKGSLALQTLKMTLGKALRLNKLRTALLTAILSLFASSAFAKKSQILIFRGEAFDGSSAHKKLLKSGLRFRRLKKSKMVMIEETDKLLATDFRSDSEFSFVEEDRQWHRTDFSASNSSPDNDSWVPDFFEGANPSPAQNLEAETSVVLGIIDSGIRINHPYFQGLLASNATESNGQAGVDDDHNGYVDDINGVNTYSKTLSVQSGGIEHGTHVASLAALSIKQSPLDSAGAVKILPINFMGNGESGSTSSALLAIDYAMERGSRVINLSWGGAGIESYSQALYEAMEDLYRQDILVITAAGNDSNNNDQMPFFPANYNLPNLMSVASVTPEYGYQNFLMGMGLSFFSNFGSSSVDVAAPGDLNFSGSSIGLLGANGGSDASQNPFVRMMGTSMAAPVVSGVAAVLRALNKDLSAYDTKQLLIESSKQSGEQMGLDIIGGVIAPTAAYAMARTTNASGTNPAIPADPVRGMGNESSLNTERAGGCAQVYRIASAGPPDGPLDGPLGGNSLLLFSSLYLISQLLRSRKSLLRNFGNCV